MKYPQHHLENTENRELRNLERINSFSFLIGTAFAIIR